MREKGEARTADRRFQRTEAAIHEALFTLMEREGFDKITVSAVAREANIDRKTFYLHYGSVGEVVDAIASERARCLVAVLQRCFSADGLPIDVPNLFDELSVGLTPDIARLRRVARHAPMEVVLRKVEHFLTEALIESDRSGFADMGPRLEYCVSFFISGLLAVYRRWLLTDSEVSLEELSELANAMAFYGLDGLAKGRAVARG